MIDDQDDFDQVLVYIHLNPVRAGLADDPVAVGRWFAEAARERQADPGFEEKMLWLDEGLSNWTLEAPERGTLERRTTNK